MNKNASSDMTIEEARDLDSKEISKLIFDIWRHEYQFDVHENDFPDLKAVHTCYTKKGGGFYIAKEDERLIGTIAFEKLHEGCFVLKRMFVGKGHRGYGIAQRLLDRVMDALNSGDAIYLSTKEEEALAAKHFYLKNGFQVIDKKELPESFPLFYEDDLFMRKDTV